MVALQHTPEKQAAKWFQGSYIHTPAGLKMKGPQNRQKRIQRGTRMGQNGFLLTLRNKPCMR